MQTQRKNVKADNFWFLKVYSILVSQSSVAATGKFKSIDRIKLYLISQVQLTIWPRAD